MNFFCSHRGGTNFFWPLLEAGWGYGIFTGLWRSYKMFSTQYRGYEIFYSKFKIPSAPPPYPILYDRSLRWGLRVFLMQPRKGLRNIILCYWGVREKYLSNFFLRWKQIPSNPRYSSIYDRSLIWKTFENVFSSILVFHDFYRNPYTTCHKHNSTQAQESNT
jgi:hypothetical protein